MCKAGFQRTAIAAIVVLWLCAVEASSALADNTASCVAKMSSYVAELDRLLATQKTRIAPFDELIGKYFPFIDCDADPLLVETTRSRFFRGIQYNPRARYYVVRLASKDVEVIFSGLVGALWLGIKVVLGK